MESLSEIYKRHSGPGKFNDKGTVHSYIPIYEELFRPYRETAKRVVEIGLFDGHSLCMWEEYFTKAEVYGIDCDEQPHGGLADLRPMIAEGSHNILIMDATNKKKVSEEFGDTFGRCEFDVVIDDGAHHLEQQLELWAVWGPRLATGGIYVIEDLQTPEAMEKFRTLGFSIVDSRPVKKRYDDILAVYRKGQ